MLAGRRVAVHVCRAGGFPQRARFEQQLLAITASSSPTRPKVDSAFHPLYKSIVSHCCPPHEDGGIVHCALKSPQFLVSDREFPGSTGLLLKLLGAGLRELREETGLQLKDGEFSWQLLALWESVYPPRLSQGLPQRHHIVVYLHLALHESHRQLQARLKPNEAEVAAVAWLDRPTLASIAATEGGAEGEALGAGKGAPSTVSILELEKGSAKTLVIPTAAFLATAQGENMERVSSGTKYALRQWLNMSSF
ncbi:nucleoside diphosphate-linked moiety X motif 17 isoform X5 [Ahaetulla prasina]|uniref:nucleoside diphosphate-linked moiety X motif 17 isoform X5 n=1 Tax=Ahaetulla prasina TaxID=499056 RepID=UPI002648BDED|nr:nucleoside diphosphate-linked moiety X motif 17 isoform X5 [Ahaetulla prasina]